jgi:hypothetical protein
MSAVAVKCPKGWDRTDTPMSLWRVGGVFRLCFDGKLLHERRQLTIRPDETGAEAYQREHGTPIPPDTFVFWRNV